MTREEMWEVHERVVRLAKEERSAFKSHLLGTRLGNMCVVRWNSSTERRWYVGAFFVGQKACFSAPEETNDIAVLRFNEAHDLGLLDRLRQAMVLDDLVSSLE